MGCCVVVINIGSSATFHSDVKHSKMCIADTISDRQV